LEKKQEYKSAHKPRESGAAAAKGKAAAAAKRKRAGYQSK